MKTTEVTFNDLRSSVLAVAPLARNEDHSFNAAANGSRVTILYGGNADFYNVSLSGYTSLLANLAELPADTTRIVPSVAHFGVKPSIAIGR